MVADANTSDRAERAPPCSLTADCDMPPLTG